MVAQMTATPTKTIPYLKELPLLGSLPMMLQDRLTLFCKAAQAGEVSGFHVGPVNVIMFNKPEYVHSVLVEHANDFDKGDAMHKVFLANGIFISEGEVHRRQRKIMAPSFQPRHIASYADTMVRYGEQFQQQWHDGNIIAVNQQMIDLTMSIIGKVLFDADVFNETDELGHAMATILGYTAHKLANPFAPLRPWPTPENLRTDRALLLLQKRIQLMVDERNASSIERNDLLSMLLNARDEDGNGMSTQQLIDECITLFGAGHETTATTLSWVWHLLCQHPDVYEKVQQEVDSVLQGRAPTYADLPQLPYCLQVIKETLRIYPPAYTIPRGALRDVDIAGYHIAKKDAVGINTYMIHRDPEYFPEPEEFLPERFTPEREKLLPRYAYHPFGAGPRICIGNHFAMMEGHLLLATLAQRVSFTLAPGQNIQPDPANNLTLRPGGKVQVIVKRRKRAFSSIDFS